MALAGANTWLNGDTLPTGAEDGILNGQDVLGLDLRDAELVVLSACETGLGDVRAGEGVFGLRRAFFLAGARTLVLSLWKVPDRQTQELMVDFYGRLMSGEPRAEALRAAQLALKRRDDHPGRWGRSSAKASRGRYPTSTGQGGLPDVKREARWRLRANSAGAGVGASQASRESCDVGHVTDHSGGVPSSPDAIAVGGVHPGLGDRQDPWVSTQGPTAGASGSGRARAAVAR